MNWGIRGVSLSVFLSLSGCALNESVVHGNDRGGDSGHSQPLQDQGVALNKVAMFVFPRPDVVGAEVEKGYFVEFEISEGEGSSILQYRD